jgi:hypothetical protein
MTIGAEATILCPLLSKNFLKDSRTSFAVIIFNILYFKCSLLVIHRVRFHALKENFCLCIVAMMQQKLRGDEKSVAKIQKSLEMVEWSL